MIVVLVTNVWISALQFAKHRGTPTRALEKAMSEDVIASCREIEAEILRVLTDKFSWESTRARAPLDAVLARAIRVSLARQVDGRSAQRREDELISPGIINWDDIKDWHARGKEACLQYMQEKYTLITDGVKEMAWWACFDKDPKPAHRQEAAAVRRVPLGGAPNPIHRTEPKVGRNEPCPCGSEKKFKKCCGR